MGDFNRGGSRGGSRGGRSFGGDRKSSFGGRGDRGGRASFGGRSQMFSATCSECGDDCEVPFKPTGGRPVLCSKCFDKQGGGSDRSSRFGGDRRDRSDRPSKFTRPRFEDKAMFSAVCDSCGADCQVPFRPSPGKPVYCDNCFSQDRRESSAPARKDGGELAEQIKALHAKMDKILKLLNIHGVEVKEEKVVKNDKADSKKKEDKKEDKKAIEVKTAEVKKSPVAKKEKAPVKAKVTAKKVVAKKKK